MKIVLIGGTRKSGTTLFHSLFDGHKDLIVPPHDLNIFYAFYPRWINLNKKKQKKRLYKVTVKDWLTKYRKFQNAKDYNKTKRILNNFFRKNFEKYKVNNINNLFNFTLKLAISPYNLDKKKCVILKETSSEFHLLEIKKKIFFINLIRDPRDIIAAMIPGLKNKYKKINETYYDLIFSTYLRYGKSSQILDIVKKNNKKINIKNIYFEALIKNPDQIMSSLCKWLKIKFDEKLLKPTKLDKIYKGNNLSKKIFHNISNENSGRWFERIDQKTVEYIEVLLGTIMKKNGYKISVRNNKSLGELYANLNDKFFFKDRFV